MGYLDKLDLDKKLESKEEYEELLEEYQFRLLKLQRKIIEKGIAVAIAYEGCDAAGKGGNIKRITESLDPRGYEVHPIGAPTPAEKGRALAAALLVALAAARPHRHFRSHLVRACAGGEGGEIRQERRVAARLP